VNGREFFTPGLNLAKEQRETLSLRHPGLRRARLRSNTHAPEWPDAFFK
jgi:hypothetical protein